MSVKHIEIEVANYNEISFDSHKNGKVYLTVGKKYLSTPFVAKVFAFVGKCYKKRFFKICCKTDKNGDFFVPVPAHTLKLAVFLKLIVSSCNHSRCHKCGKVVRVKRVFEQKSCVDSSSSSSDSSSCSSSEDNKKNGDDDEYGRAYEGAANNIYYPYFGKINTALLRKCPHAYADDDYEMAIRSSNPNNNPNPRKISNVVCKMTNEKPNSFGLTNMTWMWGQLIDHELDLTPAGSQEPANIITPNDDQYPGSTIQFNRSGYMIHSHPREHPNVLSSFHDGGVIYGPDSNRVYELRALDGSGKFKYQYSDNNEIIPPYNVNQIDNAPDKNPGLFIVGDVRGNENIALTSIHTLMVREHNRLCDKIVKKEPDLKGKDEIIFQKARKYVIAIMQNITFYEYLVHLLGKDWISEYKGYDSSINCGVMTEFSTVGYRIGHTMLPPRLQIGSNPNNYVELKNAFFNPAYVKEHGCDDILLGGMKMKMQEIDHEVVDDIRDFLFGPPSQQSLLDLATLNIQRGRDHGIPGYNKVRQSYGLSKKNNWSSITSNTSLQQKLSSVYEHPDYIDPWIGMLCEDHLPNKPLGELAFTIIKEQFTRIRNGDRYWFENDQFDEHTLKKIKKIKLSDIIKKNTKINHNYIQSDVFHN